MKFLFLLLCFCDCIVPCLTSYGQTNWTQHDFDLAAAQLLDVSIRGDSLGIVHARRRLEPFLDQPTVAAQAHYYSALANWQLSFVTFNDNAVNLMNGAVAHLKKAVALRNDYADAYMLWIRCNFWLSQNDPEQTQTLLQQNRELYRKVQSDSTHPRVMLQKAIALYYTPSDYGGDAELGLARWREAVQHYEQHESHAPLERFWHAQTLNWLGQAYLSSGALRKARDAFEAALDVRPDFTFVRRGMLPMTEPAPALPMPELGDAAWVLLADDPVADGRIPGLPDARALWYFYDAATDTLWFKFDLHTAPGTDSFGLNLAFDTDRDASTGMNWWGRNNAFVFDRLVSVWVAQDGGGEYLGTSGITDARAARLGWYTHLHRNNLAYLLDEQRKTLVVGFRHADLTDARTVHLIGTVGTNTTWNDDVTDEGYTTIELD